MMSSTALRQSKKGGMGRKNSEQPQSCVSYARALADDDYGSYAH